MFSGAWKRKSYFRVAVALWGVGILANPGIFYPSLALVDRSTCVSFRVNLSMDETARSSGARCDRFSSWPTLSNRPNGGFGQGRASSFEWVISITKPGVRWRASPSRGLRKITSVAIRLRGAPSEAGFRRSSSKHLGFRMGTILCKATSYMLSVRWFPAVVPVLVRSRFAQQSQVLQNRMAARILSRPDHSQPMGRRFKESDTRGR
ncbi:hypothetical protein SCOR_12610 [Sulfidibacter corallicola]